MTQTAKESVWDYPRPPRVEKCALRVRVEFGGEVVADTGNAYRVLETSHPPTYYIPPEDVKAAFVTRATGRSFCEFKGEAGYWNLRVGDRTSQAAAWSYPAPTKAFAVLRDHFAFYPGRVDACFVGDERVQAQEGDFYGGWITANLIGPFKGVPGSSGW